MYGESRSVFSNAADRAIARRIYTAVAEVVDMVDPAANPGRPRPRHRHRRPRGGPVAMTDLMDRAPSPPWTMASIAAA